MMPLNIIIAFTLARVDELRSTVRQDNDRGDIVTTVIMISLFAAAAIIICGILIVKATSAANKVQTQ